VGGVACGRSRGNGLPLPANPVGYSIKEKTEDLFVELINEDEFNSEKISSIMDEIVRVRAVQDFSTSEAISFMFLLKDTITDELKKLTETDKTLLYDVVSFYGKIDKAVMIAFEIYSKCREKLFEIKVEGVKNQVSGLLRRSDLIAEIPEWDSAENNVSSD